MREQILKLRAEGKTYREIQEIVGCCKSTVNYYCGKNQKEKQKERLRKRRKETGILNKIENFQFGKRLRDKSDGFQRERENKQGRVRLGKRTILFRWRDVIEKFGWKTKCYLTGRIIDLRQPLTYHFDHIVAVSRGGSNTLDNLGICCCSANRAKSNLSVEELLELCQEILKHHGFSVKKKKKKEL